MRNEIAQLAQPLFRPSTSIFEVGAYLGFPAMLDLEPAEPVLRVGSGKQWAPRAPTTEELAAILSGLRATQNTAESLKARIAEIRWQRETGGVEVMPGVIFPTTRDVRGELRSELDDAEVIGPTYANTFVIGDIRIPVTLETLRAVNATVRAHVREAFAWQAALLARLEAGEDPNTIAAEIAG